MHFVIDYDTEGLIPGQKPVGVICGVFSGKRSRQRAEEYAEMLQKHPTRHSMAQNAFKAVSATQARHDFTLRA